MQCGLFALCLMGTAIVVASISLYYAANISSEMAAVASQVAALGAKLGKTAAPASSAVMERMAAAIQGLHTELKSSEAAAASAAAAGRRGGRRHHDDDDDSSSSDGRPGPAKPCEDDGETYDFVVVGTSPGACAVAERLSQNPEQRVLLLEGGNDCWD